MTDLPKLPQPHLQARIFQVLADRMDALDDELSEAERSGNTSEQIALLGERAHCWRRYAALLTEARQEVTAALLAAQRDQTEAQLRQREAGQ